ncbi:MAG: bile acid:sodium symporter [Proteobacteria bacterium]|nr:bile acid:sodium symporter [Pseudomonadota bacterium]MBU1740893.1 bile acid:sodium symporter [Pseudomonadota bacterium]
MFLLTLGLQINRRLGLVAALTMAAGLGLSRLGDFGFLKSLLPLALFLLLYPSMFDVDATSLRRTLRRPGPLLLALAINFVVSPALIFGVIKTGLWPASPHLVAGLTLFAIMPCAGIVPAYTGLMRGNVSLAVAVTTASLVLSLVLIPFTAKLLLARYVAVSLPMMAGYLAVAVLFPLTAAVFTRRLVVARRGHERYLVLKADLQGLVGYGLILVLLIIFADKGRLILNRPALLFQVVVLAGVFLLVLLLVGELSTRVSGLTRGDGLAVIVGGTVKNTAIALGLAASAFGGEAALVVGVAGPVTQLPIMLGYIRLNQRAGDRTG